MKIDENWIAPLMGCMETAFLVDEESKKIVWSNDSPVGRYCYETFFGRTEACPFCPKLNENELYTLAIRRFRSYKQANHQEGAHCGKESKVIIRFSAFPKEFSPCRFD